MEFLSRVLAFSHRNHSRHHLHGCLFPGFLEHVFGNGG
jgi:hypothetical protein